MSKCKLHGRIDGDFIRLHECHYSMNTRQYSTDRECAINPEHIICLQTRMLNGDYGMGSLITFNGNYDIPVHEEVDEIVQLINLMKITKQQHLPNYE